jgi:anti-sigma B factor antagonist
MPSTKDGHGDATKGDFPSSRSNRDPARSETKHMTFQPTGRLRLEHAVRGGMLTLTVSGELDVAAERQIRAWLEEHAPGQCETIALDLRGVTFADSAGLRGLINADAAARRDGWSLRIVVADGPVQHALTVSGLHAMLPVYAEPDADSAA